MIRSWWPHPAWTGIAVVAVAAGCGSSASDPAGNSLIHSEHVSRSTFHGTWPLTVDAGTLACDSTTGAGRITFSPDGSTDIYAENGTAMDWASKEGWQDFHKIWLDNPSGSPGPKVDASDLDTEGQKLCAENEN